MQNPYMTESNPYMEVKNPYMDAKPVPKWSYLSEIGKGMSDMARAESEAGQDIGEVGLYLGTGMAAAVVAPVAGVMTRIKNPITWEGGAKEAKRIKEGTADLLTYQPKGTGGKKIVEALSPYISVPSILGNILERDEETAKKFGKGLPLNADKVTGIVASILRDVGEPARLALGGGTIEDLTKTVLEFYGYAKAGKAVGKGTQFIKEKTSMGGLKDVITESKGDYAIKPDVERSQRVSPEFTENVISGKNKQLQIEQKKDFTFADDPNSYIYKQQRMFEQNQKNVVTAPQKNNITSAKEFLEQPKEPVKTEANPYMETPKSEIVEPVSTPKAYRPSGETVTKPSEAVSAIEGDGKVRGLAKNTETEAIEAGLIQTRGELGELPTYAVRDTKVAQEIVSKLLAEDYNRALDIIDLKELPPKGVLPEDVFTGIRVRAEMRGDVDTLMKLVDSPIIKEGTVLGQRIQALDTQNANSPFKAMKDISKARKEELARTGEKVDPIKQNAEIERLKTLLDDANKRLEEQTVKDKPKQRYGSQNKIVTQAEYLRVKEELRAQLGSQLSAGIDPTIAAKMVKIGTYHLEAGARSFASWSKVVLEDVGEWAKPHLEDIWRQTQESIRPISNEAKNSQRYKTRLQNEVKKYSERFETFDFRKEERNKANLTEEGRRIKAERDRIKTAYDAAVRKTGGISREEATILFDLAKRAAELKNLRDPNVKGNFGFKSAKERWEYGKAQAAFDKYVAKLKIGDESISTLAKNRLSEFKTEVKDNPAKAVGKLGIDAVGEVSATSISMVASLDVSFTLRQGGKMLMTHPTIWAKSVSKQVGDVYRALRYKHGNEVAKDILHADLVSRENYMDGHYQTAGILAKFEEQYPTSHPGRIPGIGRPFKASEVAFTNTALRMRIGYFDLLLDMAKKNGAEINTKLIKDLGAVVNGLTARSHIGGSKFVNVVLWAPRMMMANVNVLTAHGLGAGLSTKFARIEAAKNLIKITAETAAVAAVLNAIVPGSIELDPRSSDFLKYKDGNTRIDMTAGSGQYITLVARFLTGQTKNTQTKIIKDLGKSGFGDRTYFDVGMDFLINKTTPLVRQGIYFAKGRNFEGRKPTAGTALVDLTTPIPIKNIADDSFGDYSDDRAIVLLSNLADVFGLNANTYMPLDQWENKESKELVAFRKRVGEQRFEEANIRYNKIVNSRISQTTKTPYYQALSDEEKEKVITRIKRQTKQQILSGY